MPPISHTYTVVPSLPEKLAPLRALAYNLRWSWDHPTIHLFRALDDALWEQNGHNPARMLGLVAQSRLVEAAADTGFMARLNEVYADFTAYMGAETWWKRNHFKEFDKDGDGEPDFRIAYFSAEFGLTECVPIYSGGLGVLAGDHIKSASDLGLPLVGIGFLYQNGYFQQTLNSDGWQIENYPRTDFYSLPVEPVEIDGAPLIITVDFPGRPVAVQVWRTQVGRVPLYLMDTNLPQNNESDRHIAGNLYGGDNETRIQQEIVLGIGGIRALVALGIPPTVCHMNEGHSAFLSLERIRLLIEQKKLTFAEAAEAAAAGNIFTTHTPVPAGFDKFPGDMMRRYFDAYAGTLGISFDELLERGRINPADRNEPFNMAALAFRHARLINGVSKLHGEVTRKMIQPNLPDFPLDEVPVGSVTNGIHTRSFISSEMAILLDKYLGEPTPENLCDSNYWAKVDTIPDKELWDVCNLRRGKLVEWARKHQRTILGKRGASERDLNTADEMLDPNIFTIGFARRFATYKRGDLLLRDAERLKRILNSADKPVQIVFAGKAHPKDDGGKQLIQHIVHFARGEDVRHRLVFLENYEITMARYLVQGVDLWLNNPRRPMEASGTSGMKVIPNGGLNFSVLDGWWAEGYDPSVGWEIGAGEDYTDEGYQDYVESMDIYETLEREIIPLYYKRDDAGVPHAWIAKVKTSMKKLAPVYTTIRMVREYTDNYYVPAARQQIALSANDFASAKELVVWKKNLRDHWNDVRIENVEQSADRVSAGESATVRVHIRLGETIKPEDIHVELYGGALDYDRNLTDTLRSPLKLEEKSVDAGVYSYTGTLPTNRSGQLGFTVRVLPYHKDAVLPQELPLIRWEG